MRCGVKRWMGKGAGGQKMAGCMKIGLCGRPWCSLAYIWCGVGLFDFDMLQLESKVPY